MRDINRAINLKIIEEKINSKKISIKKSKIRKKKQPRLRAHFKEKLKRMVGLQA